MTGYLYVGTPLYRNRKPLDVSPSFHALHKHRHIRLITHRVKALLERELSGVKFTSTSTLTRCFYTTAEHAAVVMAREIKRVYEVQ